MWSRCILAFKNTFYGIARAWHYDKLNDNIIYTTKLSQCDTIIWQMKSLSKIQFAIWKVELKKLNGSDNLIEIISFLIIH